MRPNPLIIGGAVAIVAILAIGGVVILNNRNTVASTTSTSNQTTTTDNTSQTVTPTTGTSTTQTTATQQTSTTSCQYLDTATLQADLAITADTISQAASGYTAGSTCTFKKKDLSANVIVQVFPYSQYSYDPSIWTGITQFTDIADKGFVQTPDSGNANAQAVKGNQMVYITIYNKADFTIDQEKALLKDVLAKI